MMLLPPSHGFLLCEPNGEYEFDVKIPFMVRSSPLGANWCWTHVYPLDDYFIVLRNIYIYGTSN